MARERRLRIAFAVDILDGARNGGTVSSRRFVEALAERHDVTVVTTGAAGPGRLALPAFEVPGVRRLMREMGFTFAVPRRAVLVPLLRQVDLVHVQYPFWLGIRTAALARELGTPLVAGFHVQPENVLRNLGITSPRLAAWTYRFFLRSLYHRADAVVCPSAFARDELLRHGLTRPVHVVSNGVAPRFRPLPDGERPARDGRFRVAMVGRLAPEKRHDVVVEGIRRSRLASRIELTVTGAGPERARVERLCAGLLVPGRVTYLDDEALVRLLASADLLVHASEVELEGMAVLEALGCGTPALIADAPSSAARQFAVGPDFLFRPGDPDDLARRLDALLPDAARLAEARRACLEAASRLSFDDSVRLLEEVYRGVARAART